MLNIVRQSRMRYEQYLADKKKKKRKYREGKRLQQKRPANQRVKELKENELG